jgi:hypothetical protein
MKKATLQTFYHATMFTMFTMFTHLLRLGISLCTGFSGHRPVYMGGAGGMGAFYRTDVREHCVLRLTTYQLGIAFDREDLEEVKGYFGQA